MRLAQILTHYIFSICCANQYQLISIVKRAKCTYGETVLSLLPFIWKNQSGKKPCFELCKYWDGIEKSTDIIVIPHMMMNEDIRDVFV